MKMSRRYLSSLPHSIPTCQAECHFYHQPSNPSAFLWLHYLFSCWQVSKFAPFWVFFMLHLLHRHYNGSAHLGHHVSAGATAAECCCSQYTGYHLCLSQHVVTLVTGKLFSTIYSFLNPFQAPLPLLTATSISPAFCYNQAFLKHFTSHATSLLFIAYICGTMYLRFHLVMSTPGCECYPGASLAAVSFPTLYMLHFPSISTSF